MAAWSSPSAPCISAAAMPGAGVEPRSGRKRKAPAASSTVPLAAAARAPTLGQAWVGHDGWTYRRGIGLVDYIYISPSGQEFTAEHEAVAHEEEKEGEGKHTRNLPPLAPLGLCLRD